jgi:orotate phosphoribosyltransferase
VLIVDDVMSAGTAARESIAIIQAAGATPHAVLIAWTARKRPPKTGKDVPYSAVQFVQRQLGLQVCAIAKLSDLMHYLAQRGAGASAEDHQRVLAYRARYGVDDKG